MADRPVLVLVVEPVDRPGGILTLTHVLVDQLERQRSVEVISRSGGAGWSVDCQSARGSTARFVAQTLQHAWKRRGTDVVATHLNLAPLALAAAKISRGRFVLILHGDEINIASSRARRFAAQQADLVVAISRATASKGRTQLGLPASIVRVVPSGLDLAIAEPRRAPSSVPQLLTVTRLDEAYKHVDGLLEAMQIAPLSSARLTIVGDGILRRALERIATGLGVTDRVSFTGRVDDETLQRLYRDSDLFVLPSTGEGFGLVYAEAMARGLPCIGAAGCGTEEAVVDGVTGRLVDQPTPTAIAAATAWALDQSRYAALSAAAVARARDELSAEAYGRRLFAALETEE
jgi:phosphatidylinositol alpha-1,6-mannosyltransferase